MNLIELKPYQKVFLSRGFLIVIAIFLIFLAVKNWKQVKDKVNKFFTESAHPLNLAVFRIVIFATLIYFVGFYKFANISTIVWYSQIPKQLQFLPGNLGWLFEYLPLNPETARITGILFLIFCFTGAIGLFSRTSALLVTVLGFYVLGIPQLWGKVNHYNHLLWFPAILAVSRCGDFFSVDAAIAAWKRSDKGIVEPPGLSRIYALPLRFVWLLIGVNYFFPGFWKIWRAGYVWFWSDNLAFHMYRKWFELDGWSPLFRLDRYPLLYRTSALWTVVWELAFIFLLFLPRWRPFAVLMGLVFHNMTQLFMRISFWTLQICYVAFFDWYEIFHRLGCWVFPEPMYVIYNENQFDRRTIASIKVFDIFRRITYVDALDNKKLQDFGLVELKSNALLKDIHTVVGKKSWQGFSAYRALSRRILILWLLLPLMYLLPIGDRLYQKISDYSTSNIVNKPLISSTTINYKSGKKANIKLIMTVGILFLFLSIYYNIKLEPRAWPFSSYPTFSKMQGPQQSFIEVNPINSSGETIPFNQDVIIKRLSAPRFNSMVKKLIRTEYSDEERNKRLAAFWQVLARSDSRLKEANLVRFYRVRYWLSPEKQKENPIRRELYYELKL